MYSRNLHVSVLRHLYAQKIIHLNSRQLKNTQFDNKASEELDSIIYTTRFYKDGSIQYINPDGTII